MQKEENFEKNIQERKDPLAKYLAKISLDKAAEKMLMAASKSVGTFNFLVEAKDFWTACFAVRNSLLKLGIEFEQTDMGEKDEPDDLDFMADSDAIDLLFGEDDEKPQEKEKEKKDIVLPEPVECSTKFITIKKKLDRSEQRSFNSRKLIHRDYDSPTKINIVWMSEGLRWEFMFNDSIKYMCQPKPVILNVSCPEPNYSFCLPRVKRSIRPQVLEICKKKLNYFTMIDYEESITNIANADESLEFLNSYIGSISDIKEDEPKNDIDSYEVPKKDSLYDLKFINADVKPSALIKMAREAKEGRGLKRVIYLLHGQSGTGKTAFGQYLAAELNLPFVNKGYSDIMRPLVGESEQILAELVNYGKDFKAVLQLDEMEALIAERSRMIENNHQNHNIMLSNAFLQMIDKFSGIMILTTNHIKNIDAAMFRRITKTVEFKYLEEDQLEGLCQMYFPSVKFDFNEFAFQDLATIAGNGAGDFKAVSDTLFDVETNELNQDMIISELRKLALLRNPNAGRASRHMGFCA